MDHILQTGLFQTGLFQTGLFQTGCGQRPVCEYGDTVKDPDLNKLKTQYLEYGLKWYYSLLVSCVRPDPAEYMMCIETVELVHKIKEVTG